MITGRSYDPIKRAIDIVASAFLMLLTAPVAIAVAILVRRQMGRPILFRHERPGKNGKPFELLKFRSMREPAPDEQHLSSHERITPLGHTIRRSSLDELPSLINVLRGDMSLVGPRPLLVRYLPRYTPEQGRRHEVRPGVTGLAQVSGRNALAWEQKFALDVEYVDTRSLLLDLKILIRTVKTAVGQRGVNASEDATMAEFQGTTYDT